MEISVKRLATATLLILLMASYAHATEQAPDHIIYQGKKCAINLSLMESYFNEHPDKIPKRKVESSALWRGYQASYEFQNNSLVLKDIEIEILLVADSNKPNAIFSRESVKNQVVPEGETLKIDWFSGILVLGCGDYAYSFDEGQKTYSNYILLSVKNGNLRDKRQFESKEYEKFKEEQFQAFKRTEAYKKRVSELKKENMDQEEIDSLIQYYILNYTSEFLDEAIAPKNSPGKTPSVNP
jgi:hypothetical protein